MSHIPIWVYILFIALVYLGVKCCFKSTVKVKKLLILPIGLLYLALHNLWPIMRMHSLLFLVWLLGFCLMGVVGAYYVRNIRIKADKDQGLIEIPGDYTVLLVILLIFFAQFFFHYSIDAHLYYANDISFLFIMVFSSSFASGFASGKNAMYIKKYFIAENTALAGRKNT